MPGKARFLKRPVKLLRSLISRFRFRRDRTRKDDTALTINNGAKPPLSPAQVEPPTSDEPSTPTQLEVEPPARVELPVPAQVESNSSLQLSQPQDVDKPSQPPEFSADIFKGADIENIGGSFVTTVGIGNTIHHTTVQVRDNKGAINSSLLSGYFD
ncbi:hypothetical protein AX16_001349 [Volvariella volvacea WC 439]|nr:hypothetical protein AX16_001349 [Volvariella volvacea WC 439]